MDIGSGRAALADGEPAAVASTTEACIQAVVRVAPRLGRVFKSQMRGKQLSPQHMYLLMEVQDLSASHVEGAQPGDLARRCCLSSPAITAALDDLVEAGYCVRTHSEKDRRKVLVRLTPSGLAMIGEARGAASSATREMLQGWDEERMGRLLSTLRELDEAAQSYLDRSRP